MDIEITFVGFPAIIDWFHHDRLLHSFDGNTVKDLVESLLQKYGEKLRECLWDPRANGFDPTIQVVINNYQFSEEDRGNASLSDGDRVTFLRLLAGG